MKTVHWIAVGAAIIMVAGIFLFADTTGPKSQKPKPESAETPHSSFDFNGYLAKVKSGLDTDTSALISELEKKKDAGTIASLYKRKGESVAEAFYLEKNAAENRNPKSMQRAAELFSATAAISENEGLTAYLKSQAVAAYTQLLSWDSTTENRIKLATAILDEGTQPMQGVGILLEIVRKDSNNADAQLMLGKFGLVSGQYEKAVIRLEKVIYLRPRNPDALFLLATAYQSRGEKQKALEALYKCEKLVTKPELKKEIEAYIAQIKAKG